MLLEQLPTFTLFVALSICCAVKHLAVVRMLRSELMWESFVGPRWWAAGSIVTAWGFAWMFLMFSQFIPVDVAFLIAIADAIVDWVSFAYGRSIGYFSPSPAKHKVMVTRLCHASFYLIYVWFGLRHI